jgi:hypothetical protein
VGVVFRVVGGHSGVPNSILKNDKC